MYVAIWKNGTRKKNKNKTVDILTFIASCIVLYKNVAELHVN